MEIREEAKAIRVDYKCPKCGVGRLRPTDTVLTVNPPGFPHKCTKCDYGEILFKVYPYIDYEVINKGENHE